MGIRVGVPNEAAGDVVERRQVGVLQEFCGVDGVVKCSRLELPSTIELLALLLGEVVDG